MNITIEDATYAVARGKLEKIKAFRIWTLTTAIMVQPSNQPVLGTCQKLAGGEGGWNFKFGFGNEVAHLCNGSEIC